jgi:hypothetical protein
MRDEIARLVSLGPLPSERDDSVTDAALAQIKELILAALPLRPLSEEEACALAKVFGPDECYEMAWTLVHMIESTPGWPMWECLPTEPEWRDIMLTRLRNVGLTPPEGSN